MVQALRAITQQAAAAAAAVIMGVEAELQPRTTAKVGHVEEEEDLHTLEELLVVQQVQVFKMVMAK